MKYAIIEIGGHQIWVQEGQYFWVNQISTYPKINLLLNKILFLKNNKELFYGYPYLEKVNIYCRIKEHILGSKINIFKMRSKKKYRKKTGYRQKLTKLLVTYIKIQE